MTVAEMECKWQAALRKYFPTVIVREVLFREEDNLPLLGVYMIPDEHASKYMQFSLDERPDFVVRENLPDCDLSPSTASVTREHFPSIWAEAQSEIRRNASSAKVRSRKKSVSKKVPVSKKSSGSKTARRSNAVSN